MIDVDFMIFRSILLAMELELHNFLQFFMGVSSWIFQLLRFQAYFSRNILWNVSNNFANSFSRLCMYLQRVEAFLWVTWTRISYFSQFFVFSPQNFQVLGLRAHFSQKFYGIVRNNTINKVLVGPTFLRHLGALFG